MWPYGDHDAWCQLQCDYLRTQAVSRCAQNLPEKGLCGCRRWCLWTLTTLLPILFGIIIIGYSELSCIVHAQC